jgi:uncharacterized protein with NRDE domain
MCTLIVLRRPGHAWPLLLAANRDEMAGRPWKAPARHWPDRSHVVAGLDELAGGSWLGLNDDGLAAGILNRVGSLGPMEGKRSRGELVLEALDHAEATEAAQALLHLNPQAYRPFNLLVADAISAYWLKNDGHEIGAFPIEPGLHMLTAHDLDDASSPRIQTFLPLFGKAATPNPESGDWEAWERLLATGDASDNGHNEDPALLIRRPNGFGTVSSALIALPPPYPPQKPILRFAAGPPDQAEFRILDLG